MWKRPIRLIIILASIFLVACINTAHPVRETLREEDWNEYVVYRIDDYRHISIRSPQKCNGHLDGNIYYNDTRSGVRTFVSFTGPMRNGLYRGYYAIHSDKPYIAIPAIAFSQTRGMLLRIYYSYDSGKTFQWFLAGEENSNLAIIVNENKLYLTAANLHDGKDYTGGSGVVFDISKDMDWRISHYDSTISAFDKYAKEVYEIPRNLKSPSGYTHWGCPSILKK